MAVVGYARVSSVGQSLDVQLEKLKGCDKVFKEKRSGVDTGRPALSNVSSSCETETRYSSLRLIAWLVRPRISIASFPSSERRESASRFWMIRRSTPLRVPASW
jgi:Resolvase, N terminal domain